MIYTIFTLLKPFSKRVYPLDRSTVIYVSP